MLDRDDVIELLDIELRELLDSELPELIELLERELEVERLDLELLELLGNVFELVELLDLELTLRELRELLDRELRELLDFDEELRELVIWELLDWELWKPLVDDELFEELEELDITGLPNYEGTSQSIYNFIAALNRTPIPRLSSTLADVRRKKSINRPPGYPEKYSRIIFQRCSITERTVSRRRKLAFIQQLCIIKRLAAMGGII